MNMKRSTAFIIAAAMICGAVLINPPGRALADEKVYAEIIRTCMDESSTMTPGGLHKARHIRDFLGLGCMISDGRAPRESLPNLWSRDALKHCGMSLSRCESFADAVVQQGKRSVEAMRDYMGPGSVRGRSEQMMRYGMRAANTAYGN